MKKAIVIIFFASFFSSPSAYMAHGASVKKSKKVSAPAKKVSPIEILTGAMKINQVGDYGLVRTQCKSDRFKLLAEALSLNSSFISRPKGEFETTEHYQKSTEEMQGIFSDLGAIWVCFPVSTAGWGGAKYSADDQHFSFDIFPQTTVHTDEKELGSINGRTVGGIPFTYTRTIYWRYRMDLIARKFKGRCAEHGFSGVKFTVPAPVSIAPSLKQNGTLILEAKIVAPFIRETRENHNASLTERYEDATRTLEVPLDPIRFIVVDGSGNELWSCGAER